MRDQAQFDYFRDEKRKGESTEVKDKTQIIGER